MRDLETSAAMKAIYNFVQRKFGIVLSHRCAMKKKKKKEILTKIA